VYLEHGLRIGVEHAELGLEGRVRELGAELGMSGELGQERGRHDPGGLGLLGGFLDLRQTRGEARVGGGDLQTGFVGGHCFGY